MAWLGIDWLHGFIIPVIQVMFIVGIVSWIIWIILNR